MITEQMKAVLATLVVWQIKKITLGSSRAVSPHPWLINVRHCKTQAYFMVNKYETHLL